jgi:nucleoid DNA-binding protein
MIKIDIVKTVAERLSLKDKDALIVVDQTIECMKELIVRNRRLEIRNFGVFRVKTRKARVGRNPKNKKTYPINEHQAVTFKGGKGVKEIESGGVAGN